MTTLVGCTRFGFDPSSEQSVVDARHEGALDAGTLDGALDIALDIAWDVALPDAKAAKPVAIHFGGTARESLGSLHLGVGGDIYVAGSTTGDFTIGSSTSTGLLGALSGYTARITPAGEIVWSVLYQSSNFLDLWGIGSDGSGGVFVAGYVHGTTDFGGVVGSVTTGSRQEVFVLFADSSEGVATSLQRYSGASNFQLRDLAMGDGEFVISGFYADNVATAFGAVSLPANGRVDQAFLLRMDTTGVEQAAYRVDTDRIADGTTVTLRQSGGLCLGGRFAGNADFDGDSITDATFKGGYGDAFVVALRADGSTQWFRTFGTAADDQVNDLVAVGDDCVAVGHLGGAVTLPSGQTLGGAGGLDGFAMRLAAAD
ncbi:MAG: hypothetical protein JRH20_32770, partial [Deltaproteobacteria bacterium]|nr:hypothetical protein [Deltaproteobacteria bacterium]